MDLNIWLILAQIINFWILFFVFKKFLWDSLIKLIKERRRELSKLENVSSEVEAKMNEAEEKAGKIISDAKTKIVEMEQNSINLAKANKEKILNDANREAQAILLWARTDIEKERNVMLNSIKSKVIDLSLKINEKLFEKERVNKDFIEKEINSIKM